MKIKNKIYLFSTVWLLLILLLINSSIYFLFYKVTTNGELERLKREAIHIIEGMNAGSAKEIDAVNLLQPYLPSNGMIRVINENSKVMIRKEVDSTKPIPAVNTKFERKESAGIYKKNGGQFAYIKIPIIWNDGKIVSLEMTERLDSLQDNLNMLKNVLVIASLFVLIPSFFAGRMLSKLILKPVNSLIQTMEHIQDRGIFKKISLEKTSKDELYKMGTTFNKMIDLLHQNFEKQQQFVSDASHELRTPLTVIESYSKLLKRWGMKKQDVLEESVEAIYSEAVRMKGMTNQMLLLANSSAEWKLETKESDLVRLCKMTAEQLEKTYNRDFRVITEEEKIIVNIDEQKIKQVLVVLLDNAMKYSKDSIDMIVGIQKEKVFFSIQDYGMGIPKEDIQKVFDRFFRVDKARSRETGGTGLGLSIAKQIIDAHEGDIQLESEEGKWTKVTVNLPHFL
ncbi:two-component sensor histidine kinase [Bacillus thuringiensis serovar nigeriensis]|uniref:sensor histidine kinase n=1 Tax=Bacillus thuringiensis TaxID=1428 RepID=UPI000A3803BD|nr:ATP-binding protein [Bacillus thuringiensis]MEC3431121.1 ATP-binding protein [Bacillus cereus]MRC97428.1 HAMP domain-containing protein [Bacillus thuringiensis]OTX17440.1 two-component sensor histidine kinase [Bacillus thuringiensis serovar nigeriensis]